MHAIWVLALLAGADEGPAAMVLKAGAGAWVTLGKTGRPVHDADMLPAGANLEAGKSDLILFIRKTGATEKLAAGHSASLRAGGCVGRDVTKLRRGVRGTQLKALQKLMAGSAGVGFIRRGTTDGVTGNGISPIPTSVIETGRPTFRWAAVDGAEWYEVQLYRGSKGDLKPQWQVRTTKPMLKYPAREPLLRPGSPRTWGVLVKVKGKDRARVLVADAEFTVMDEEAQKMVAALKELTGSKDSADWLLAAVSYESIHAHGLAQEQYQRVDKARPDQEQVLKALEYGYRLAKDVEKWRAIKARLRKLRPASDS